MNRILSLLRLMVGKLRPRSRIPVDGEEGLFISKDGFIIDEEGNYMTTIPSDLSREFANRDYILKHGKYPPQP